MRSCPNCYLWLISLLCCICRWFFSIYMTFSFACNIWIFWCVGSISCFCLQLFSTNTKFFLSDGGHNFWILRSMNLRLHMAFTIDFLACIHLNRTVVLSASTIIYLRLVCLWCFMTTPHLLYGLISYILFYLWLTGFLPIFLVTYLRLSCYFTVLQIMHFLSHSGVGCFRSYEIMQQINWHLKVVFVFSGI